MKKLTASIAFILACMLALTACGGSGAPADAQGGARDSITVSLNVDPTSLHAGFATSVVSSFVGTQLFDTLIRKTGDGQFEPCLATEWSFSEDGRDITFTLRDDVTFHNGDKMTAEDVAFSYNTVLNAGFSGSVTSAMTGMDVVDETHVVLHFEEPYGPAIECVSQPCMGIFSKAAYEADPDGFPRNPVGTGAYQFVQWKADDSITLKAYESYFQGKPSIENLTFKIYKNATSAALALENGELDLLTSPSSTDYTRLSNNESLQFGTTVSSTVTWLQFSMKGDSIFKDENLRLAVAHAIDKESVILGAVEGQGELAKSVVPSYSFGIGDFEMPEYNPEKAKEYLAAAGYADGLDLTVYTSNNELYYKPLEIVQAQLAEVGINCNVERMDQNAWFEDVFKSGEYPFVVVTFSCTVPDIDYYYPMFVPGGSENFGQIELPELTKAYSESRFIVDETERAAKIQEVAEIMAQHAIVVPMYGSLKAVAANKNIVGLTPDHEGIYRIASLSWAE